jgi:hypothetical protein
VAGRLHDPATRDGGNQAVDYCGSALALAATKAAICSARLAARVRSGTEALGFVEAGSCRSWAAYGVS